MSEVIVASTTDSPEEVARVAALDGEVQAPETTESVPEEPKEEQVEQASAPETTQEQPEEVKPRKGFEKRIDRLTSRNRELEEQLAAAQDRLTAALSRVDTAASGNAGKPQGKPTPDQYPSYEDYVEAVADWKAGQRETARAQQEAQAAQKAVADAVDSSYRGKLVEAESKYQDWEDTVGKSEVEIPVVAADAIKSAVNGPDIVYHLAKNPEICEDLASMTPMQAVLTIGSISSSLANPPAKPVVTSKAPAPVRGVGNRAASGNQVPLDELPYQEYKRARNQGRS